MYIYCLRAILFLITICVPLYVYVHMGAGTHRDHKKALIPLKLDLQTVLRCSWKQAHVHFKSSSLLVAEPPLPTLSLTFLSSGHSYLCLLQTVLIISHIRTLRRQS